MKPHKNEKSRSSLKVSPYAVKNKTKVLARWTDGLYYFVKIKRVSAAIKSCSVEFEDKSTAQVDFKDLLEAHDDGVTDCHYCGKSDSDPSNAFVKCSNCERFYHQKCHIPQLKDEDMKDGFVCRICVFASCAQAGGAKTTGPLAEKFAAMKCTFPYELKQLTWQSNHTTNTEQLYCYCGGPGCWYNKMLQCCRCKQWFHEACLQCLKQQLLVGDHFYIFACAHCNHGKEFLKRMEMKWLDVTYISLFHLIMMNGDRYVEVDDLITCIMNHSSSFKLKDLLNGQHVTWEAVQTHVLAALGSNSNLFLNAREQRKRKTLYGLRERILRAPPSFSLPGPGIKITKDNILQASSTNKSVKFSPSKCPQPVNYVHRSPKKSITPTSGTRKESRQMKLSSVKYEHNYCTPLKCPDKHHRLCRGDSPSSTSTSSSDTIEVVMCDTASSSSTQEATPASPSPSPPGVQNGDKKGRNGKAAGEISKRGNRKAAKEENSARKRKLEEDLEKELTQVRDKRRQRNSSKVQELIAALQKEGIDDDQSQKKVSSRKSENSSLVLPAETTINSKNNEVRSTRMKRTKSESAAGLTRLRTSLGGKAKNVKPQNKADEEPMTNIPCETGEDDTPMIDVDMTPPSSSLSSPILPAEPVEQEEKKGFWSLDTACPWPKNFLGPNNPFLTEFEQASLRRKYEHFEGELNRHASSMSNQGNILFPAPSGVKSVSGFKSELSGLVQVPSDSSEPEYKDTKLSSTPENLTPRSRRNRKFNKGVASSNNASPSQTSSPFTPLVINGGKISPILRDNVGSKASSPAPNACKRSSPTSSPISSSGRSSRLHRDRSSLSKSVSPKSVKEDDKEDQKRALALQRCLKNLTPTCGFHFPVLESDSKDPPKVDGDDNDEKHIDTSNKSSRTSSPLQAKTGHENFNRKGQNSKTNHDSSSSAKRASEDQENIRRSKRSRTTVDRFQAALEYCIPMAFTANSGDTETDVADQYEVISLRMGMGGRVEYLIDWQM